MWCLLSREGNTPLHPSQKGICPLPVRRVEKLTQQGKGEGDKYAPPLTGGVREECGILYHCEERDSSFVIARRSRSNRSTELTTKSQNSEQSPQSDCEAVIPSLHSGQALSETPEGSHWDSSRSLSWQKSEILHFAQNDSWRRARNDRLGEFAGEIFMLLNLKDLKSCLRSLILSFWLAPCEAALLSGLVQNLSSFTEGFPTCGNDNVTHQLLEQSSLWIYGNQRSMKIKSPSIPLY